MAIAAPPLTRLLERVPPAGRVDREAGVIYGVKVLGRLSGNSHNVRGASSTEYGPEAWASAVPVFEGLNVNANHRPRTSRDAERNVLDRCGWLKNVRAEPDGVYADLHLFTSHPLAGPLMEAAEKNPGAFGLSIDAYGRGEVRGGKYVVTEIVEANSVDVVDRGATVTGLFESQKPRRRPMRTVRQVLEALVGPGHKERLRLLEAMDYDKDKGTKLMEQPMDGEGGEEMIPPPPPPAEAPAGTLEDSLSAAVVAVLNDPAMDKAAKRKKILGILNLLDDDAAAAPVEEMEGDDKDKEMMESLRRERDSLKGELDAIRLCESENVKLSPTQMKALRLLTEDKDRRAFLAECRSAGSKPRTQAPLREGRGTQTAGGAGESPAQWLTRLTGRRLNKNGRN